MPSKFKFSLDSADATARQFSDIKHQLQELPPSIVNSVKPMVDQITKIKRRCLVSRSGLLAQDRRAVEPAAQAGAA